MTFDNMIRLLRQCGFSDGEINESKDGFMKFAQLSQSEERMARADDLEELARRYSIKDTVGRTIARCAQMVRAGDAKCPPCNHDCQQGDTCPRRMYP